MFVLLIRLSVVKCSLSVLPIISSGRRENGCTNLPIISSKQSRHDEWPLLLSDGKFPDSIKYFFRVRNCIIDPSSSLRAL